jgi:hypothetical protein
MYYILHIKCRSSSRDLHTMNDKTKIYIFMRFFSVTVSGVRNKLDKQCCALDRLFIAVGVSWFSRSCSMDFVTAVLRPVCSRVQ